MGLSALRRRRILAGEENPPPPDENSALIMTDIDGLKPELRALVHEYGWIIVRDCYDGGLIDNLSTDLETWRERRQEAIGRCDWGPENHPRENEMHSSSAPRTEPV